ncbi:MAG: protein translocase subunit SecD [Gammaproteobacteria bacterium]|nr:protein translocase subunit SecD [Gammaproteobacteria bacterium]
MNRYPLWKYILISIITGLAVLYALPNLYGKDPAVQISSSRGQVTEFTQFEVEAALDNAGIEYAEMEFGLNTMILRFSDEEVQLRARDAIRAALDNTYVVALNLAAATPDWLDSLGGEPMFLGLDLRGGVNFLLEVDMDAAILKAEERYVSDLRTLLRDEGIRYRTINLDDDGGLFIRFRDDQSRSQAIPIIENNYLELSVSEVGNNPEDFALFVTISDAALSETRVNALQQNITTLRKRVNELGVAEPVIQQQGQDRIVVQLPGVQDTARAKEILGATATLEFRMVDMENDVQAALEGRVPPASRLYYTRDGIPLLIKRQIMLTGEYIIGAASGIDAMSGGPNVSITLDGRGERIFRQATADEVGKNMAIIFIENKTETVEENGELVRKTEVVEEVISNATILEQLGKRFQITGLDSPQEARNLALLLRAGALAAPVQIIEERTVGPSLGQENIDQGFQSVMIGFLLVLVFMLVYYKVFGIAANIALTLNLVLIVSLLSLLQATLTLPGIAGIVLTVGMAVDANVLIYERIREELKNGNSPHASIHAGYEKAFSTIADANITTLIAALVLFSFGTGPIKGFAVTLCLGIICSMFTAIMVTRAIVNLIYGGRRLNSLAI